MNLVTTSAGIAYMRSCWQQNPWGYTYPPGWNRGGPHRPDRKWFSENFLGSARERMAVSRGENLTPYWWVLNFSLAARDSLDGQVVPRMPNTALCALMADQSSATQPGNRTRLFQIADENMGFALDRQAVDNLNRFGTGRRPFYLRVPHFPPDYGSLFVRCGNLVNAANTVQLCFFFEAPRPKTQ
jgi:hypothetical protein